MAPKQSGMRVVLLIFLVAALLWGAWTLVNSVRLGSRDSDPAIYWSAVALIALVEGALSWLSLRTYRRLRG